MLSETPLADIFLQLNPDIDTLRHPPRPLLTYPCP